MRLLHIAAIDLQDGFDDRMIRWRSLGDAAVQLDMFGAGQRRLVRSVHPGNPGIVEHQRGPLRNAGQADHAGTRGPPSRGHGKLIGRIGDRRRRGEFGNQQLGVIDLRHHEDLAELGRDRRPRSSLIGGLRNQLHARIVAADFEPERIASHRALGTIIDPSGFGFPFAPGVGGRIDLGG